MGQKIEVVFEPNTQFSFKSLSGPLPISGSIAMAATDSGTEVTYHATGEAAGVLGLGETIISGLVNKQVEEDLKALKKLLQSG